MAPTNATVADGTGAGTIVTDDVNRLRSSTQARTPGSTRARPSPLRVPSPIRTRDTWTATVDYGDGSASSCCHWRPTRPSCSSTRYADNGSYTVTVAVTDGDGDGDRRGGRRRSATWRRRSTPAPTRTIADRRDFLEVGFVHRPRRRHVDGHGRLRRRHGRPAAERSPRTRASPFHTYTRTRRASPSPSP